MHRFGCPASALACLVVVPLALGQGGCGVLLQTALGWSEEKVERTHHRHTLSVTTSPAGAHVVRQSPSGPVDLGLAPVEDSTSFVRERAQTEAKNLGLYVGGGVTTVGGTAIIALGANQDDGTVEGSTSAFGLIFLGTLVLLGGLSELAAGALYGALGGSEAVDRVIPETYGYVGQLQGRPPVRGRAVVPYETELKLAFEAADSQPSSTADRSASLADASASARSYFGGLAKPVVAVMEVEDVNAHSMSIAIDGDLVRNLGNQIRIFIAQRGVRTVDRGAQERALQERIRDLKVQSYRSCYDDACQIELGKALAATHILRSRITRFGSRCVLNAELIDLRSEVTVRAASARGGCEAEGFLGMSEQLSRSLLP